MTNPRSEAAAMLSRAQATGDAVRRRAAWDYRAYFAWGIWLLLCLPPFDFVNGTIWGIVVSVTSGVGTSLTILYFSFGARHVHLRRAMRVRRWLIFWAVWGAWYAAWIVAASYFHNDISFAFTLVGIAGAVPCFIAGYASWRAR